MNKNVCCSIIFEGKLIKDTREVLSINEQTYINYKNYDLLITLKQSNKKYTIECRITKNIVKNPEITEIKNSEQQVLGIISFEKIPELKVAFFEDEDNASYNEKNKQFKTKDKSKLKIGQMNDPIKGSELITSEETLNVNHEGKKTIESDSSFTHVEHLSSTTEENVSKPQSNSEQINNKKSQNKELYEYIINRFFSDIHLAKDFTPIFRKYISNWRLVLIFLLLIIIVIVIIMPRVKTPKILESSNTEHYGVEDKYNEKLYQKVKQLTENIEKLDCKTVNNKYDPQIKTVYHYLDNLNESNEKIEIKNKINKKIDKCREEYQ